VVAVNVGEPVASGAVLAAVVRRPVDDWQAAIRLSCSLLEKDGAVTAVYADRCIAMVEEHGPYIVLAPGIALAHARPQDGVIRLGVSVATLSEPVSFGHNDNDPVDVVFAFGSPDNDQHVELLSKLAQLLLGGLADRLRDAEDDATARSLLEEVTQDE
jgi:ascorbate PTS system EIIA or EIIAB component